MRQRSSSMQQVVQNISGGATFVRRLPDPMVGEGQVLVAVTRSLVSPGTERYVVELARESLVAKALHRPDHVRRVLQKARQEGVVSTLTQVRARLDEAMPLGYSAAGVVIACGANVSHVKPGDRVACAAPHASLVVVGRNLCVRVPDAVSFDQAAYAAVAAIALQGVRLAKVTLGDRVLVVGLGLIGQITVALLKAQGCAVFGTDVDASKVDLAKSFGADETALGAPRDLVSAFARGYGVDAAVITAATTSNEPIEFAAEACRAKGRIVLVGVAGLNLPRPLFFQKELEFTVSSSLGPGRGDAAYEEKGQDYPIGHARWTAQRNMEAVLDMIAARKLPVETLTTHRFPIEQASRAYELITRGEERYLGIELEYAEHQRGLRRERIDLESAPAAPADFGIGLIGAGNFARVVMLPALSRDGRIRFRGICTARGLNAVHTGEKYGFAFATSDVNQVLGDAATSAVVIATRHNLHADLVIDALRAGKHVLVEKPLCIVPEELDRIAACVTELGVRCPVLMVGFNRRFAPAIGALAKHFSGVAPLSVSYRFAPGALPPDAWPHDPEIGGGRIVGEACHAIDTCAALHASPPVRVYAESVSQVGGLQTTDDRVFITIRHLNGGISNISYQAGGDRAGPVERIEVFGGGRTATVEGWDTVELWADNRRRRFQGHKDKGHKAEFRAFIDACREGDCWPVPWEHIYGTTWASLAAVRSLREGLPIDYGAYETA
jgi:predicted dehydrogenase/threonine dehydrogenase-like Zn-dependent dehydrogenase